MNKLIKLYSVSSSSFNEQSPKHYYKVAYKKESDQFFISVMTTSEKFDLDMQVTIKSVGSEIVSTEPESSIKEAKGSLEAVTH